MIQHGPKMAQNYLIWPKNDARIYALFPQIFLTEKEVPQTFSLLECRPTPPWAQWLRIGDDEHNFVFDHILNRKVFG